MDALVFDAGALIPQAAVEAAAEAEAAKKTLSRILLSRKKKTHEEEEKKKKKKRVVLSGSPFAASAADPPKIKFDDRAALLRLIQSCAKEKNLWKTRLLHSVSFKSRFIPHDVCLSTALLGAYARSGAMADARAVFEQLPMRNAVSWTALISGYVANDAAVDALLCFRRMQDEGVEADSVTYVCVLKACGAARCLTIGEEICTIARKRGLLHTDLLVGNAAIAMFAKCGNLVKARHVFEELPVRDTVSWNTMISAYSQHGAAASAVECFRQMQTERIRPDLVTYVAVLKSCAAAGAIDVGKEICAAIQKDGRIPRLPKQQMIVMATALIDMYSKCGELEMAREILERSPARDAVSWTALIAGYIDHGHGHEALKCFVRMQEGDGISPDAVAYACALKACGVVGWAKYGEEVGSQAAERGLLPLVGNAMIGMYARCGAPDAAREAFDRLPTRDVVSWNSLMAAYARTRRNDEVVSCFRRMHMEEDDGGSSSSSSGGGGGGPPVRPDAITYACVLKACAAAGSLDAGRSIDAELRLRGFLQSEVTLGNALVEMYAMCGEMAAAREAFDRLAAPRQLASWNALMAGNAKAGRAEGAVGVWRELVWEGVVPDGVTFLWLLAACSHAGRVEEGEAIFGAMGSGGVAAAAPPEEKHYTCMVDLFARAGDLGRATGLLVMRRQMEEEEAAPGDLLLPKVMALMRGCQRRADLGLGRWAFQRSMELDQGCAASYVCIGSMYAAAAT